LENNVIVATGAKVLGSIVIGENSKIGGGSVVLKDVPPDATVVGIPGRIVKQNGKKITQKLDHHLMPDPILDRIKSLEEEMATLKAMLEQDKGVNHYEHNRLQHDDKTKRRV